MLLASRPRKHDSRDEPGRLSVHERERAAVSMNDFSNDRQTEPDAPWAISASRIETHERLDHVSQSILGNAWPVVEHIDTAPAAQLPAAADRATHAVHGSAAARHGSALEAV